jgi:hypothetical protein
MRSHEANTDQPTMDLTNCEPHIAQPEMMVLDSRTPGVLYLVSDVERPSKTSVTTSQSLDGDHWNRSKSVSGAMPNRQVE